VFANRGELFPGTEQVTGVLWLQPVPSLRATHLYLIWWKIHKTAPYSLDMVKTLTAKVCTNISVIFLTIACVDPAQGPRKVDPLLNGSLRLGSLASGAGVVQRTFVCSHGEQPRSPGQKWPLAPPRQGFQGVGRTLHCMTWDEIRRL
jgi:hypothetical protein